MRYDDWDVILFPRDSHVPIQEFRTACYSFCSHGSRTPTLACYIKSLPPRTPFRISVHSWATPPRPSCAIESRKKSNQKIMYKLQVTVDEVTTFDNYFDIESKWPQEIARDKRNPPSHEYSNIPREECLEFPRFSQDILVQATWDARDTKGRINILLSEQLIPEPGSARTLGLGMENELVNFSFQHAPKEILEQTGISWPIANPLYLPQCYQPALTSSGSVKLRKLTSNAFKDPHAIEAESPLAHASWLNCVPPQDPKPGGRPSSHPPPLSHFSKPALGKKGSDSLKAQKKNISPPHDHRNLDHDPWLDSTYTGGTTNASFMRDHLYAPLKPCVAVSPWFKQPLYYHSPKEDDNKSIMESMSKNTQPRSRSRGNTGQQNNPGRQYNPMHTNDPPNRSKIDTLENPSSMIRNKLLPSYIDIDTSKSLMKASPGGKSSYMIFPKETPEMTKTTSPLASKGDTLIVAPSKLSDFPPTSIVSNANNSSVSRKYRRNPSTIAAPGLLEFLQNERSGVQALPNTTCQLDSENTSSSPSIARRKKEGQVRCPLNIMGHEAGYNQNLDLRPVTELQSRWGEDGGKRSVSHLPTIPAMEIVEVIDIDAIDPSPTPNPAMHTETYSRTSAKHKSSTSSIDSTGRIERQLFSALGEELGSFEQHVNIPSLRHDVTQAFVDSVASVPIDGSTSLPSTIPCELEVTGKRKRKDTLRSGQHQSRMDKSDNSEHAENVDKIDLRLGRMPQHSGK